MSNAANETGIALPINPDKAGLTLPADDNIVELFFVSFGAPESKVQINLSDCVKCECAEPSSSPPERFSKATTEKTTPGLLLEECFGELGSPPLEAGIISVLDTNSSETIRQMHDDMSDVSRPSSQNTQAEHGLKLTATQMPVVPTATFKPTRNPRATDPSNDLQKTTTSAATGCCRPASDSSGADMTKKRYMSGGRSKRFRPSCIVEGCPNSAVKGWLCCISHGAKRKITLRELIVFWLKEYGELTMQNLYEQIEPAYSRENIRVTCHLLVNDGIIYRVHHGVFQLTSTSNGSGAGLTKKRYMSGGRSKRVRPPCNRVVQGCLCCTPQGAKRRRRGVGAEEVAFALRAKQSAAIGTAKVLDRTGRPIGSSACSDDEKDDKKKDTAHSRDPTATGAGVGNVSDTDNSYASTGSSSSDGSTSSESEGGKDDSISDSDSVVAATIKAKGGRRSGRKRSRKQVNYNLNAGDKEFEQQLQEYQEEMYGKARNEEPAPSGATSTNTGKVEGNTRRNGPADLSIAGEGNQDDDFDSALNAAIMLSPELFP